MTNKLVTIQPGELKFPFELKKQSSCSLQLVNNTDNYVAFKVKTTSIKKYAVRPNRGFVPPKGTYNVTVTMQALREAPPGMQCKDKFLVQSIISPSGATFRDITSDMFNKEPCRFIEENKLRVVYVSPTQFPSTILESSEEGYAGKEDLNELKAKLFEAQAKTSILTEEKSASFQQKQELVWAEGGNRRVCYASTYFRKRRKWRELIVLEVDITRSVSRGGFKAREEHAPFVALLIYADTKKFF